MQRKPRDYDDIPGTFVFDAERSREVAVRNLKASFLLREIADKERIYVLDSEVQEQVEVLAARQGWTRGRTERDMEENDLMQSLRWDLREEKTLKPLVENARVEEIDPEEFARRVRTAKEQPEEAGNEQ